MLRRCTGRPRAVDIRASWPCAARLEQCAGIASPSSPSSPPQTAAAAPVAQEAARDAAATRRAALARAAADTAREFEAKQRGGPQRAERATGTASAVVAAPAPASTESVSATADPGRAGGGAAYKIKRKAPWGAQQLRDAWSEDAMSRHDKDSVGGRIEAEFRFHPESRLRRYIKWMAYSMVPLGLTSVTAGYYWASGYSLWKVGDLQSIFNVVRQLDTSPRSALYAPRNDEGLATGHQLAADGTGAYRRRVGAREEYDELVKHYRKKKALADEG